MRECDAPLCREASYFAMCLLMPEDMMRREFQALTASSEFSNETLMLMAEEFQVEEWRMLERLYQLKLLKVES